MHIRVIPGTVNGTEINVYYWGRWKPDAVQWSVRLSWGQIGLWRNSRSIINWLNPLVWCRHGSGLHLRGRPIES